MSRALDLVTRLYAELVLRHGWISRRFPFRPPPLLLMAYPRSGSSWIAQLLGFSPDLAYLREPVTQPFLASLPAGVPVETVFDPRRDADTQRRYRRLADYAYQGILRWQFQRRGMSVADFRLGVRGQKRLFIKEVNPMAAAWHVEHYAPEVLLLLRHPAAVADSYIRAGWIKKDFEQFAMNYGTRMHAALRDCQVPDTHVVRYEDFAAAPEVQLKRLYKLLEIRPPDQLDRIMRDYCHHAGPHDDMYDIRRSSAEQIDKWRRNLDAGAIAELKRGFFRSPLAAYRDEADWPSRSG